MKRIICYSFALSILLLSCESDPEADFYINDVEPEVGHEVFFTNASHNAKSYEWDFGDGYNSYEENPGHIYTGTGTFTVTLTVFSRNGLSDEASLTVEVMVPTLLEIEVREYYDQYTVPGASVYLFSSITDWDNSVNIMAEGFTDENGIVVFSHLDPFVYYVDVWEQDHDNYILRSEDVGFIRTPEILPHHINRFVAWVDYYVVHKKGEETGKTAVIKKIERMATDRIQPEPDSGNSTWNELYEKSVSIER